jgi:hypothetical protein
LSYAWKLIDINRIKLGNLVEELFTKRLKELCNNPNLQYGVKARQPTKELEKPPDTIKYLQSCRKVDLTGETNLKHVLNCLVDVWESKEAQLAFLPKKFPVIDLAGPGRCVVQINIATKHPLNPDYTKQNNLID